MPIPQTRSSLAAAGLALLLAACTGERAPEGGSADGRLRPVARQENGVTILDYDGTAFDRAPRFTLEDTAITTAGGMDIPPEYDLSSTSEHLLLSDGRLVVSGMVAPKGILFFNPDGSPQRIVGSAGEGPGEFKFVNGLLRLPGDTVLVLDGTSRRITLIAPDGAIARLIPSPKANGAHTPIGRLANGDLVSSGARMMMSQWVAGERVLSPLMVLAADTVRTVFELPHWEIGPLETRYGGVSKMSTTRLNFSRSALIAMTDSTLMTASDEGHGVDFRGLDGAIRIRTRIPVPRVPVTDAMQQRAIADELEFVKTLRGYNPKSETVRQIRNIPAADSLPAFSDFFATPSGRFWAVDDSSPLDSTMTATEFLPDGTIGGRLTMPKRQIVVFGDDRVVFRTEDADGAVRLTVHRIRRPAPA